MADLSKSSMITIMSKMFSIIGLKFDWEYATQVGWCNKHTWNKEQEKEFTNWLTPYLRKELHITKKEATKQAMWFNIAYGWKSEK